MDGVVKKDVEVKLVSRRKKEAMRSN